MCFGRGGPVHRGCTSECYVRVLSIEFNGRDVRVLIVRFRPLHITWDMYMSIVYRVCLPATCTRLPHTKGLISLACRPRTLSPRHPSRTVPPSHDPILAHVNSKHSVVSQPQSPRVHDSTCGPYRKGRGGSISLRTPYIGGEAEADSIDDHPAREATSPFPTFAPLLSLPSNSTCRCPRGNPSPSEYEHCPRLIPRRKPHPHTRTASPSPTSTVPCQQIARSPMIPSPCPSVSTPSSALT